MQKKKVQLIIDTFSNAIWWDRGSRGHSGPKPACVKRLKHVDLKSAKMLSYLSCSAVGPYSDKQAIRESESLSIPLQKDVVLGEGRSKQTGGKCPFDAC